MSRDFPFLRALLDDDMALPKIMQDVYAADRLAQVMSESFASMGIKKGVAVAAMLLYIEQGAEDLAKKLNYDLGPQPKL